ncbi:MAG TPA: tRNA (adenosine(37)-N6)-dimethylallyltransferase MiaA [Vicinamibacterales bacterium]
MVKSRLLAIVGPTATGKSALGIALARWLDGEIVSCDSTAIYQGIDIGTDKVPPEAQQGIPHHMIDLVPPTEAYSAARYATDAAAVVRGITARGRLPILVGGTGLYYRALVRGMFPGPARHPALRAALEAVADRRGVEFLHRMVARLDPESARRIAPRDRKRLVRALEVAYVTGVPLTTHFAQTQSPIADYEVITLALRLPAARIAERVALRVDQQFARGVVDEVRGLLARGVPRDAHALSGLVYRQVLEMLEGVRDEAATRALIVQENRRYARRQLIWFRKEPNLLWLDGPGEAEETFDRARALLSVRGFEPPGNGSPEHRNAPDQGLDHARSARPRSAGP